MKETKAITDEEIIKCIEVFILTYNYSPSLSEIMLDTGIRSKSTLYGRLRQMRKKGLVNFVDNQPRTITIPQCRVMRCEDG